MTKGLGLVFLLISLSWSAEGLFYLMGTYAYIELPTKEEVYKAYKRMREIEQKLSDYIEYSEVSRINASAGKRPVKVSLDTFEIIKLSIDISKRTYSYFDITYGAVSINHKRLKRLSYDEAKELVDYRKIQLYEREVFLPHEGMAIDLGGIGKGYAVEKARRALNSPWGFISVAGDMKVWGMQKILAIKDPLGKGSLLQFINRDEEVCISTSGNYYRKHIEQEDRHLIQITVAHRNCAYADAFATALFAMPRELRRKFEQENPNTGIVEVYSDGSLYINSTFRKLFFSIVLKDGIESQ